MNFKLYLSVIILISLIFTGCLLRDNPKLKVYNKSDSSIDSIYVYAVIEDKTIIKNINSGEKRFGTIFFEKVPNADGAYMVKVFNNGKVIKETGFGYYTNGASLDYGFKIEIKNDTIIINHY